jgi:tetratricopeptide (TPR) repeat protein
MEALRADKRSVARRSLSLANSLEPNEKYTTFLKQIEQPRRKPVKAPQKKTPRTDSSAVIEAQKQELNRLFGYFEAAYERQDWFEASDYMEEIERLDPKDKKTRESRKRLDQQTATYVQQQIKLGEHQYSQGDFTVALETWEAVYPLAPDNKALNKYIRRAKRVLNRNSVAGRRQSASR